MLEAGPEMTKEETVRVLTAQYDRALNQVSGKSCFLARGR